MTEMHWMVLDIAVRWVHIVSAIVLAGGAIFMRFALLPALTELPDHERPPVRDGILKRWKMYVHAGAALVLLSGFGNFALRFSEVKPMPYHMLFGLKLLLGIAVIVIASALVGRARGLQGMRNNARLWLNVNVILAMILVAIGGVMRVQPKRDSEPATVNAAGVDQPSSTVVRPVATSNSASNGTIIATTAKP